MPEISEKEIKILNLISENQKLSQRHISNNIGISLGMVNIFLKKLVKKGLIKISKTSNTKSLKYILTAKGFKERFDFNMYYLKRNLEYFSNAKKMLILKLRELEKKEISKIYIYGIDEWSEIIYLAVQNFDFKIIAFINNNIDEITTKKFNYKVFSFEEIENFSFSEKQYVLANLEEKNNSLTQKLLRLESLNFIFF
jgi:DNA-binding MarR family transcriptional regulator